MSIIHPSPLLKRILILDAASCALMGVVLAADGAALAALLQLPELLLRSAGAALIASAALVGFIASRRILPPAAVWLVIALNGVWAVDSVLALVLGWLQPSPAGLAVVVGQALAVAVIAELELVGLKRSARLAAA